MQIESIKVRLAFKLASLVQGGGSGGGRTISNADYEVIYKSLYQGGTGEILTSNLLLVRHELAKSKFASNMMIGYGQLGQHNRMTSIGHAILDASFNQASGRTGDNQYSSSDPLSTRLDNMSDAARLQIEEEQKRTKGIPGFANKHPDLFKNMNITEKDVKTFPKLVTSDLAKFPQEEQDAYALNIRKVLFPKLLNYVKELDPELFKATNETNQTAIKEAMYTLLAMPSNYENPGFGFDPVLVRVALSGVDDDDAEKVGLTLNYLKLYQTGVGGVE